MSDSEITPAKSEPPRINPNWKWTMLLEDLVNRSKRGSNIYHRVMSPTETIEVVPYAALDALREENEELSSGLKSKDECMESMNLAFRVRIDELKSQLAAERAAKERAEKDALDGWSALIPEEQEYVRGIVANLLRS